MYRTRAMRFWILIFIAFVGVTPATARAQQGDPAIPFGGDAGAPGQEPIYGVVGTLRKADGQVFSHYFTTVHGNEYGLVGETAMTEQEIGRLNSQGAQAGVKVWGVLYRSRMPPLLVAREVLSEAPVSPAGVVLGARTEFTLVSLYSLPDLASPRVSQITPNNRCSLIGRNQDTSWLQLECDNGVTAWGYGRLFLVDGNPSSVPVITPDVVVAPPSPAPLPSPTLPPPTVPPPTPTPVVSPNWTASYFANSSLLGPPAAVASVPDINFDWQAGSPHPSIPPDSFSIRFERTIETSPGYYQFSISADDGVRVYLDDQLIIDEWHSASGLTYTVGRLLRGAIHRLRVEFFEGGGNASVRFLYQFISNAEDWDARYYGNVTLFGQPLLTQKEPRASLPLDYNWGSGSPMPNVVPVNNWSARWEGSFDFQTGNYVFQSSVEGGVRVYIDNLVILDGWSEGAKEIRNTFHGVGVGRHTIRVEYYSSFPPSYLRVWWYIDPNAALDE